MIKNKQSQKHINDFFLLNTISSVLIKKNETEKNYYKIGNKYYKRSYNCNYRLEDESISYEKYLSIVKNNNNLYIGKDGNIYKKPHVCIKFKDKYEDDTHLYFNNVKQCRNFIKNNLI